MGLLFRKFKQGKGWCESCQNLVVMVARKGKGFEVSAGRYGYVWGSVGLFLVLLVWGGLRSDGEFQREVLQDDVVALVLAERLEEELFDRKQSMDEMVFPCGRLLDEFYAQRKYEPIWLVDQLPTPNAMGVIERLENCREYGLLPEFYKTGLLRRGVKRIVLSSSVYDFVEAAVAYEVRMTQMAMLFAGHVLKGVYFTDTVKCGEQDELFDNRWIDLVKGFAATDDLKAMVRDNEPGSLPYLSLRRGLVTFLQETRLFSDSATIRGWEFLDDLILGQAFWLRDRHSGMFFNGLNVVEVSQVLARHQMQWERQYVLERKEQLTQFETIMVNLERLRRDEAGESLFAWVNIPSYKLRVYEEDSLLREHSVIVGEPETPTPVLSSAIKYVVFNPDWMVPRSIIENEMIPVLKRDSTFLMRKDYLLLDRSRNVIPYDAVDWSLTNKDNFPYFIRQRPSYRNSLGVVKFLFPNEHSVYLHDTNARSLFRKEMRAMSHGCIRLSKPVDFSKFLLEKEIERGMDVGRVLKRDETLTYILHRPLPIYIRYLTCEAVRGDEVLYYEDIYDLDARVRSEIGLQQALN